MTEKKRAHKVKWERNPVSSYLILRCTVCGKGLVYSPFPDLDRTEYGDDCPGKPEKEIDG